MPLRRGCRTLSTAPPACLHTSSIHTLLPIHPPSPFIHLFTSCLHFHSGCIFRIATIEAISVPPILGGFHFAKIIISTVRDKNTGLRKRLAFPNWQKYKIMQNHSIFRIPCVTDKEIVKILALQALCLFVPLSIPYLSLVFVLYCD